MSKDFIEDAILEGFCRILGEVLERNNVQAVETAPAKPLEIPPPNPAYPEGAKYRVLENDWWHDTTTDDVLVVIYSSKLEVLFRHPRGRNLVVPMGMIDDFEKVCDEN